MSRYIARARSRAHASTVLVKFRDLRSNYYIIHYRNKIVKQSLSPEDFDGGSLRNNEPRRAELYDFSLEYTSNP